MLKLREFIAEHWAGVLTVAVFTVAVFLIGKLSNSCIVPPPVVAAIRKS
jgi:hypothetical protein